MNTANFLATAANETTDPAGQAPAALTTRAARERTLNETVQHFNSIPIPYLRYAARMTSKRGV